MPQPRACWPSPSRFCPFLAGLGSAVAGVRGKMQGDPDANWWATSALVLAIPAVLLILFA